MSARKTDDACLLGSTAQTGQCLMLSANEVRIRKSGIEFHSNQPISTWTEMTVSLQIPRESRKLHCHGVIVACNGNERAGYMISMLFTNLTRQSQATLSVLAT